MSRTSRRLPPVDTYRLISDGIEAPLRGGFLRVAFPARLDYRKDSGFQTPAKSLFISNLTQHSGPSCEQWYDQRGSLSTVELFAGWARLGPLLQEDQCQIDQM